MKALRSKGTHIWIVRIFETRSEPLRTRPETINLSYQFHLGISPRYFLCKMLDSSYLNPGRNLNLSSGAPESAKLRRLRYLALSLPLASLHSPCQRHYEIKSRQSHSTSPHIKFSPSWHHLHKPSSLHSDLPYPSHSKNTPSTPFPHTNNHLPTTTTTPTPTPTHHSPLTNHAYLQQPAQQLEQQQQIHLDDHQPVRQRSRKSRRHGRLSEFRPELRLEVS